MLTILINFSTLKSGGGQNVALNFLYAVRSLPLQDVNCWYLVAKDSEVHRLLKQHGSHQYVVVPRNALLRILYEVFWGWRILKKHRIDIVYSYFGYAWFPKRWPQISGSADSNLYFPEIDFWSGYRGVSRLKRWVIDQYRLFCVKRANAVIFENAAMEKRGRNIHGLKNTCVIKPSIYITEQTCDFKAIQNIEPGLKRGLFLCGWQLNKNVMLIPLIAAEMKKRNRPLLFVLTAPRDGSSLYKQFCSLLQQYGVESLVTLTGPAIKDQLACLYDRIDYVFLLSQLESFSNNIIEAWYYQKPLLIADEIWAHSICDEAAFYTKRNDIKDIADKLCLLMDSEDLCSNLVEHGTIMLKQYPSIGERIVQEIEYVKQVHQRC